VTRRPALGPAATVAAIVAACVACCVGPLLALISGLGLTAAVGALWAPVLAILAVAAAGAVWWLRHRSRARCSASPQVADLPMPTMSNAEVRELT